ncbi:hypothetical protein Fcan01_04224 [Folsomia candida]|uniref:Uncharacterized protein n=1 Tax=Folsomia candida TaxID=158441 RepID=A0A226ENA8_FOLCA|nr:hypothetical protein Fcan01_04224 [Folsomia candida]
MTARYVPLSQSEIAIDSTSIPTPRQSPSVSPPPFKDGGGMWMGGRYVIFRSNRYARLGVLAVIIIIIVLTIRHMYYAEWTYQGGTGSLFEIPHHIFGRPSDFSLPHKKSDWFDQNCYPPEFKLGQSIGHVYEKLEYMKKSKDSECTNIWTLFNEIFTMEGIDADLVIPEGFQAEVKGWLGNDPELFKQIHHQKIYKIVIKGSHEETVFNPLRSKRPTSKSSINPVDYIANLSASTQSTCDFCQYKDHTAEDVFGRIDNKYSASASNTFKLAKFHGLFFPKTHHPVNISFQALLDLFVNTSQQWYPSILWDVLPHAGASQVHPHVHGLLGVHQYSGAFEKLHAISQEYYAKHHRSYWTDLIKVHDALGLVVRFGDAVAMVPLFSRKDHEYMILAPQVDDTFATLIYTILEGYKNNLGVYCFSAGGAYPFLGDQTRNLDAYLQPGLPAIFRSGSRGLCTSVSSDVSSLELYTVNNINSDISVTLNALKKSIETFLSTDQNIRV